MKLLGYWQSKVRDLHKESERKREENLSSPCFRKLTWISWRVHLVQTNRRYSSKSLFSGRNVEKKTFKWICLLVWVSRASAFIDSQNVLLTSSHTKKWIIIFPYCKKNLLTVNRSIFWLRLLYRFKNPHISSAKGLATPGHCDMRRLQNGPTGANVCSHGHGDDSSKTPVMSYIHVSIHISN